jgi:hypothetical protein
MYKLDNVDNKSMPLKQRTLFFSLPLIELLKMTGNDPTRQAWSNAVGCTCFITLINELDNVDVKNGLSKDTFLFPAVGSKLKLMKMTAMILSRRAWSDAN